MSRSSLSMITSLLMVKNWLKLSKRILLIRKYQIVNKMRKKTYKITFDLKEGYDVDAKVHALNEVSKIIAIWMSERLETKQPVLSFFLQDGQLIFPTVGTAKAKRPVTLTPSATLTGELSTKEDMKRTDKEVKQ